MKKIIICVASLDGKIAKNSTDNIDWTSKEDRKFFAEETKKSGVIIMGSKTHENIGKPLPDRLNIVYTSKDKNKSQKGILEYTKDSPSKLLKRLEKKGYKKVFIIGGQTVNSLFLKNKLIDEIWLTIESFVIGGGISLFDESDYSIKAKLLSSQRLGRSGILLKYKLIY